MTQSSDAIVPLGAMRFNSDSQKLEYWNGSAWFQIHTFSPTLEGGARAIFMGGGQESSPYNSDVISAFNMASGGTAIDFGNTTEARRNQGQFGSAIRGFCIGGANPSVSDRIDFVTFSTTGNATDFGNLTVSRRAVAGGANATRGIGCGGNTPSGTNTIDYITMASSSNAVDFGDATHTQSNDSAFASPTRMIVGGNGPTGNCQFITIATTGNSEDFAEVRRMDGNDGNVRIEVPAAGSNATRGLFAGGEYQPSGGANNKLIIYTTIATLSEFSHFGDLTANKAAAGGAASKTRFVSAGGATPSYTTQIESVQIATLGDAVDFGDLAASYVSNGGGSCNDHGGLG